MEDWNTTLENAIRKRILEEISARRDAAQIINNFQNQAPLASESRAPNSLQEAMFDPGAFDYLVDIEKTDEIDPETGKSVGWKKKVHRYRKPREEMGF